MDLGLMARVLWRFKMIVIPGFVLAIVLAALSIVRVDSSGISYRHNETWVGYTQLFVTQQGFPWGSLSGAPNSAHNAIRADPGRLASLAMIYSNLANGDAIRGRVARTGPIDGTIQAAAIPASSVGNDVLPIISLAAFSTSAAKAKSLSWRWSQALIGYIDQQQRLNALPDSNRVVVQVLSRPDKAKLFKGRSKSLPIVVFLAVMLAVGAAAFILENVRPKIRSVASISDAA